MGSNKRRRRSIPPAETPAEDRRESVHPGGGQGRTDEVGHSGVQPVSIPHAPLADAVVRTMAEWGQGERGAAGFQDHGDSELIVMPPGVEAPSTRVAPAEKPVAEPQPEQPQPEEGAELKQQPAGALPSGLIRNWRQPTGDAP
jgi:hypothetical protein